PRGGAARIDLKMALKQVSKPMLSTRSGHVSRSLLAALLAAALALFCASAALAAPVWLPGPDFSVPGTNSSEPQLAINPAGEAVAVWKRSDGTNEIVETASRPPGGNWSQPKPLSTSAKLGVRPEPEVAIDPAGEAVAVWAHFNGPETVIEAA